MLKEEVFKIIRRRQFLIIAIALFGAALVDFLMTCEYYYGMDLSYIRSAYICGILNNEVNVFVSQLFSTLFALVVCIGVSDVYDKEQRLGINNFIYTRTKKKKNIRNKIFAIIIVGFLLVAIPLLVNLLLTLTAFPLQGYYCSNTAYLTLVTPEKNRVLSYFETYYPYLNILIYIFIRSVLGVTFALFAFSLSLLNRFNHYIILFSSLIYYYVVSTLLCFIPSSVTQTAIFSINGYGSIWMFVLFIGLTNIISGILIVIGSKKEII